MRRVDYESGAFKVSSFAALPSITEASRSRQTISVNGRWVKAESLIKGIDDAYRATDPSGRYPPVALCVELIKDWLTSRYPDTCPHGRSICYRLEHKDIARKLDSTSCAPAPERGSYTQIPYSGATKVNFY